MFPALLQAPNATRQLPRPHYLALFHAADLKAPKTLFGRQQKPWLLGFVASFSQISSRCKDFAPKSPVHFTVQWCCLLLDGFSTRCGATHTMPIAFRPNLPSRSCRQSAQETLSTESKVGLHLHLHLHLDNMH